MKVNRRTFLKASGAAALGLTLNSGLHNLSAFSAEGAASGKKWGMVVDVTKLGTREDRNEWVKACKAENNVPTFEDRKIDINWIRMVSLKQKFPDAETRLIPMLCNQCEDPPCVQVCPVSASFMREDGIVLIDEHRCIGCRYCMIACPYRARSFNFKNPEEGLKNQKRNPKVPMRKEGVVEKCTFCVHRIDEGIEPACVEACNKQYKGAFTFGDLNDPTSEVSKLVASGKAQQIRPDLGTKPKVYYIGL